MFKFKVLSLVFFSALGTLSASAQMADPPVPKDNDPAAWGFWHSSLRPLNWGEGGPAKDGSFLPNEPYPFTEDRSTETEQPITHAFARKGHCVGVVEFRRLARAEVARGLPVPLPRPADRIQYIRREQVRMNREIDRAVHAWISESQKWLEEQVRTENDPSKLEFYHKLSQNLKSYENAVAFNALRTEKALQNYAAPFGASGGRLYMTGIGGPGHAVEVFDTPMGTFIVDPNIGDRLLKPNFGKGEVSWTDGGVQHRYGLLYGAPWLWPPLSARIR